MRGELTGVVGGYGNAGGGRPRPRGELVRDECSAGVSRNVGCYLGCGFSH